MKILMIAEQPRSLSELNGEFREFATNMGMIIHQPSLEEVTNAIAPHFPDQIVGVITGQELLERLGLVLIEDTGQGFDPKRISWSVANTDEMAATQLAQHKTPAYCSIRQELDINYHWILLDSGDDYLYMSKSSFIDYVGGFDRRDGQDCWICDVR